MRKKIFAILMSAMMMVTFMPAMSFAAANDGHAYGHKNTVAATTVDCGQIGVKYVAQKCGTCEDETLNAVLFKKSHEMVTKTFTSTELMELLSQEAFKEITKEKNTQKVLTKLNIAKDVAAITTTVATVYAKKNNNASAVGEESANGYAKQKALILAGGATIVVTDVLAAMLVDETYDLVMKATQNYINQFGNKCTYMIDCCKNCGLYDVTSITTTNHVKPANTPACAQSFTCEECKKDVAIANNTGLDKIEKHINDLRAAVNDGNIVSLNQAKEAIAALMDVQAPAFHKWVKKTEEVGCGTTVQYTCEACGIAKDFFICDILDKQHTFEDFVLVAPTCTKGGVEVQRCKYCKCISPCGIKFTDKLGHMSTDVTVEPTCTTPGYTYKVCETCGQILSFKHNFVKATGHDYKYDFVVEPTCSSAGLYKAYCEDCGREEFFYNQKTTIFTGFHHDLTAKKIPATKATGHDYNVFVDYKAATCDQNAVKARKCSKCGHLGVCAGEVKEMKGTALGHTYELLTVAPTCKADGYTVNVCTTCKKSFKDEFGNETKVLAKAKYDVVPAIGGEHDFTGNWVTFKKATIFEEGTKAVTCAKCGIVEPASYKEAVDKLTYGKPITRVNGKKITVTVTKKTDAVKYAVQIRNTGYDNWKTIKTLKKAGTVTKKLKKGGYSIRILATSKDGLKAYSQHTKIKVK